MDLIPKIQLNIVLSDHNVEKTVETIIQAARTGNEGDGLIFIYPVDDVVRIRTGERGGGGTLPIPATSMRSVQNDSSPGNYPGGPAVW